MGEVGSLSRQYSGVSRFRLDQGGRRDRRECRLRGQAVGLSPWLLWEFLPFLRNELLHETKNGARSLHWNAVW